MPHNFNHFPLNDADKLELNQQKRNVYFEAFNTEKAFHGDLGTLIEYLDLILKNLDKTDDKAVSESQFNDSDSLRNYLFTKRAQATQLMLRSEQLIQAWAKFVTREMGGTGDPGPEHIRPDELIALLTSAQKEFAAWSSDSKLLNIDVINIINASKKLKTLLDTKKNEPNSRQLDLNGFAIKPDQRVGKYKLLARELYQASGGAAYKPVQSPPKTALELARETEPAGSEIPIHMEQASKLETAAGAVTSAVNDAILAEELRVAQATIDARYENAVSSACSKRPKEIKGVQLRIDYLIKMYGEDWVAEHAQVLAHIYADPSSPESKNVLQRELILKEVSKDAKTPHKLVRSESKRISRRDSQAFSQSAGDSLRSSRSSLASSRGYETDFDAFLDAVKSKYTDVGHSFYNNESNIALLLKIFEAPKSPEIKSLITTNTKLAAIHWFKFQELLCAELTANITGEPDKDVRAVQSLIRDSKDVYDFYNKVQKTSQYTSWLSGKVRPPNEDFIDKLSAFCEATGKTPTAGAASAYRDRSQITTTAREQQYQRNLEALQRLGGIASTYRKPFTLPTLRPIGAQTMGAEEIERLRRRQQAARMQQERLGLSSSSSMSMSSSTSRLAGSGGAGGGGSYYEPGMGGSMSSAAAAAASSPLGSSPMSASSASSMQPSDPPILSHAEIKIRDYYHSLNSDWQSWFMETLKGIVSVADGAGEASGEKRSKPACNAVENYLKDWSNDPTYTGLKSMILDWVAESGNRGEFVDKLAQGQLLPAKPPKPKRPIPSLTTGSEYSQLELSPPSPDSFNTSGGQLPLGGFDPAAARMGLRQTRGGLQPPPPAARSTSDMAATRGRGSAAGRGGMSGSNPRGRGRGMPFPARSPARSTSDSVMRRGSGATLPPPPPPITTPPDLTTLPDPRVPLPPPISVNTSGGTSAMNSRGMPPPPLPSGGPPIQAQAGHPPGGGRGGLPSSGRGGSLSGGLAAARRGQPMVPNGGSPDNMQDKFKQQHDAAASRRGRDASQPFSPASRGGSGRGRGGS